LHIGDEEDEPIEPAQTAGRRRRRRFAGFLLVADFGRGFVVVGAAPIGPFARAA